MCAAGGNAAAPDQHQNSILLGAPAPCRFKHPSDEPGRTCTVKAYMPGSPSCTRVKLTVPALACSMLAVSTPLLKVEMLYLAVLGTAEKVNWAPLALPTGWVITGAAGTPAVGQHTPRKDTLGGGGMACGRACLLAALEHLLRTAVAHQL